MPKSKKRAKVQQREAVAANVAQRQAETKKLTPAQYVRRRAIGWTLVALAVLTAVTHLLAHIGVLYDATGLTDLTIGYPIAGVLGVAGAITFPSD